MSKLTGGILQAAGILIAGASGLCSLVVLVGALGEGGFNRLDDILGFSMLVLVVGGVPFMIGVALFVSGRRAVRRADERDRGG